MSPITVTAASSNPAQRKIVRSLTGVLREDRNGGDAGRRVPWDDLPSRIKTATEAR